MASPCHWQTHVLVHTRICEPSRHRVHTVGNTRAKQGSVSHCLEHISEPAPEIHTVGWLWTANVCEEDTVPRNCLSHDHKSRCRIVRVCSSSSSSESISDPINNNGFEFSVNVLHLVRQSAFLKSHFVKSSVTGPPSRSSFFFSCNRCRIPVILSEFPHNPPMSFQCRLNFHCCCASSGCSLRLLDSPGRSDSNSTAVIFQCIW